MGQNGSSPGLEKRGSKKYAPGDFNPPSNPATRRSTVSGATSGRRYSSAGMSAGATTTTPHRRAASTASNTVHAAHRANNIASTSPPPYSAASRVPQTIPEVMPPVPRAVTTGGQENALELLKQYDTVFLIDDSGSMAGGLWREAGRALADVARVAAQYDDDGLDIHFLNSRESLEGVTNEEQVRQLFTRVKPQGQTPTGARLDSLLRPYIASITEAYQATGSTDPAVTGIKPINFIVITDGAPTDEPEDVIVDAARKLDRGDFPLSQLGVQFVQIGNDPEATAALEELDDDLAGKYGIRDIVDTTPYTGGLTGETLIKILLGGINRRVDKRGGASVMR
ncbi:von willebrand factor type A domain protein [Ceratobasidium sp. AG-Ba]|nr:von willebrand factor type A domain protein [Ceratobasidium sp. AG-Ba]